MSNRCQGISAAHHREIRVAVVAVTLSDGNGVELGVLLKGRFGIPFIVISDTPDTPLTVSAMKAGALDVIDKPVNRRLLLSAVSQALALERSATARSLMLPPGVADLDCGSTARRWAGMVLAACAADSDPRTVPLWGRAIGASTGTLEETCRLCGIKAHNARDLARFLRALSRTRRRGSELRGEFAVADARTLRSLFDRAGLSVGSGRVPLSLFLAHQRFVCEPAPCLRELTHLAEQSGLF